MNDQELQIRPMIRSDIEAIVALEQDCNLSSWGIAGYEKELTNSDAILMVALWQSKFAGFFSGRVLIDEFELFTIAIVPQLRRKRIAQRLMQKSYRELQQRNIHKCFLEVRASNQPALELYQSFGFELIGKRRNYYQNPKDDALLMRKFISRLSKSSEYSSN